MRLWDIILVVILVLAALVYLVIYIKKELSSRKAACVAEGSKVYGSTCNACGKKTCPIEKASDCESLKNKDSDG